MRDGHCRRQAARTSDSGITRNGNRRAVLCHFTGHSLDLISGHAGRRSDRLGRKRRQHAVAERPETFRALIHESSVVPVVAYQNVRETER